MYNAKENQIKKPRIKQQNRYTAKNLETYNKIELEKSFFVVQFLFHVVFQWEKFFNETSSSKYHMIAKSLHLTRISFRNSHFA